MATLYDLHNLEREVALLRVQKAALEEQVGELRALLALADGQNAALRQELIQERVIVAELTETLEQGYVGLATALAGGAAAPGSLSLLEHG